MLGLFPSLGPAVQEFKNKVQAEELVRDTNVVPHIANILGNIDQAKTPADIDHLSNIIKQTNPKLIKPPLGKPELPMPTAVIEPKQREYHLVKLQNQMEKLKWAGLGLSKQEVYLLENHMRIVAQSNKVQELRFFGKILAREKDYYVLQGIVKPEPGLEQIPPGAEKRGEGVNYYNFWVSTNLLLTQWTELPLIRPDHIKTARKIKLGFTGQLVNDIKSYPSFDGEQRHYLKAQLVRMVSSLQLVPKGIMKLNDQNPKIVEYQDEPKVPEFSQLSTLETWTHRNANLLNLGRCTHYIDPATPEDQLQAVTAQLTEKDPEIQRLRGITEDKLPQGNPLGIENVWQVRLAGDTQVFQKQQATNVYAVAVLKNVFWPGWVTIGYKGGFCNYYTGYGHKWTQPSWSEYENPNLGEEAEDAVEFSEPNPKEEPKPVEEPPVEPPPEE